MSGLAPHYALHERSFLFGSPADPSGPVALRPRLTTGLPCRYVSLLAPSAPTGRL
jgi:hypothetical protein